MTWGVAVRWLAAVSFLGGLLLASACGQSRYACASDRDCLEGRSCIHFNIYADDYGSACKELCSPGCAAGSHCTSCPDSPTGKRCTKDDGGFTGAFCEPDGGTLYPMP